MRQNRTCSLSGGRWLARKRATSDPTLMMPPKETRRAEGKGSAEGEPRENARVRTQSRITLSANLARVNEAAWRDKSTRFTALLHHVDVGALERAFRRLKRSAVPGVDGETVASYEQELAQNLQRLHAQVHSGRYRPPRSDGYISPRLTVAKGLSVSPRSKIRLFRVRWPRSS